MMETTCFYNIKVRVRYTLADEPVYLYVSYAQSTFSTHQRHEWHRRDCSAVLRWLWTTTEWLASAVEIHNGCVMWHLVCLSCCKMNLFWTTKYLDLYNVWFDPNASLTISEVYVANTQKIRYHGWCPQLSATPFWTNTKCCRRHALEQSNDINGSICIFW